MEKIDIQNLVPYLLEVVPEIRGEYEEMAEFTRRARSMSTTDPDLSYDSLREMAEQDGVYLDLEKPGVTIVFEDLLVPFIISLVSNGKDVHRLREIMDWIECLANNKDFQVRNIVAGSVCESLLTTYQSKLEDIYPYLGEKTKDLCRIQLAEYRLDEKTVRLFEH